MTVKMRSAKVKLPERLVETASPQEMSAVLKGLASDVKKLGDAHDAHDDTLAAAINGGISSQNNSLILYKTVRVTLPVDAPFQRLALNTGDGWTDGAFGAGFGLTAEFLMEPGGWASLRGLINGGVPDFSAASAIAATLAAGYRPLYEIGFTCEGGNDGLGTAGFGAMRVQQDGGVRMIYSSLATQYFFLNSCRWLATSAADPHPFPAPWPVVVEHGLERCTGLDIVGCRRVDQISGMAGAAVPDWEDIGGGRLRLNGVWGLQWGRSYNLRLRITAEKE